MNLPYPQSIPCAFDGFPVALDIRMGASAGDISPGASLGTKFVLSRTPKCGIPQGDYVIGLALPECRMIYSDTGSDDAFSLKVSFLGYGTFYRMTNADQYLRFQVFKAIALETPSAGEKVFGDTFDCETLIPATADVTALFSYDGTVAQYVDPAMPGLGVGTVLINEGGIFQEFTLSDGASITVTSETGVTITYTFIGGVMVIR